MSSHEELTFEEFCDLPIVCIMHVTLDWGAIGMYQNVDKGLMRVVTTKRKRKGDIFSGWKDEVVRYVLDGDSRTHDTVDQLYLAYMERACGIKHDTAN